MTHFETLDFRVDWGYQFLYSRRQYHPEYVWDGHITVNSGEINNVHALEYPYEWWGIVHSPRETALDGTSWQSTTRRGMAGIRVQATCPDSAKFTIHTRQGDFEVTARQIREKGRIVFHVGPERMHCSVIITYTGYLWFRPPAKPGELVIEARATRGADVLNFARMEQVWIEAGNAITFDANLQTPIEAHGQQHWLMHLHAMTAKDRNDISQLAQDFIPFELRLRGKTIAAGRQFLRHHDNSAQILHDVFIEVPFTALRPGTHELELVNLHPELPLLIHRISFRPRTRKHLDMRSPKWAVVGKPFIIAVRTLTDETTLRFDGGEILRFVDEAPGGAVSKGIHKFRVVASEPTVNAQVTVFDDATGETSNAVIDAIYALPPESPEVKVGYDMTTVPHDDTGVMDWLLDYTHRTQLGNLVCFRPFPREPVADELVARWGNLCRQHAIYAQGINMLPGPLPKAAGAYYHASGDHELSGAVYAWDPEGETRDMKHAMERFIDFMRGHVESTRAAGATRVTFGDASGAHHFSLMAGADFLRAETFVPHTQLLCSHARGAARALARGEWGVHIAIQHAKQPYLESHLQQYYLSLMQPWMMGASFIYEEDSLFVMFKEERQCWDDKLTKGKRDLTREFFRFASTHPRWTGDGRQKDGKIPAPDIRIAYVNGRYAAPFNGFICGCEQDPSYRVWGRFGKNEPTWAHLQPEKAYQVLDVLMPGASTHPLRQRFDRREFFLSGTPFGDFDQVPVEGGAAELSRYKLLLHLGWNTMLPQDYADLKHFVESGGTLLIGVPQFSTHLDRGFLETMEDLALINDGDLSDLCGARVIGHGARYSGHWLATDNEFRTAEAPPLSRVPSVLPDEDGPCHAAQMELCGAIPVIVDAQTGAPLLLKHPLGSGTVYLLTTWAYFGHEELADLSGAIVQELARRQCREIAVADSRRRVFWNFWKDFIDDCGKLNLLNTNWSTEEAFENNWIGVQLPDFSFPVWLPPAEARIVTVLPFGALVPLRTEPHVEVLSADVNSACIRIHATGVQQFRWHSPVPFSITCNKQLLDIDTGPFGEQEFRLKWTSTTFLDLNISIQ